MDDKAFNILVDTVTKSVLKNYADAKTEYSKKYITLSAAKRLCEKIEKEAERIGLKVVVAVSNAAARPVVVECMDDSFFASYDIAVKKAYTSVAVKMSTLTLKSMSQPEQGLYGIQFTNQNQIVIFGGGVTLEKDGEIIGGLGVSGGSEEQDVYLAEYGKKVFEEELS